LLLFCVCWDGLHRAALQLYNVSAEDFCGQQQAAWLSAGGQTALQAWQLSNEQLLQALRNTAGQVRLLLALCFCCCTPGN
jgi:phosphodiesterase/alkaline phosphatase D-like protein